MGPDWQPSLILHVRTAGTYPEGRAALIRYLGETNCLLLFSSFITVSALLPTLAIAASISGFDFLKYLHQ